MVGPKPFSAAGRLSMTESSAASEQFDFDEVFRCHYGTVYAVLVRITGSPEEAEDLAQDVFLRLHVRQAELGTVASLGGWLYRVATNVGFNAVRSRRRLHHRLTRWARLERPIREHASSPAADVESRQDAELVRRALSD
jgi:RNA polymerase sigma factor (sigma-70 family)